MKKRYFIPLVFMLLVAAVGMTACGSNTKYDTGTWAKIESQYGTQGFHCTPEAGMEIDGYLDEAAWNEKAKKLFTHTEAGCSFVVRSYYNVSGMYFGMTSRDYNVIYARRYGLEQLVNTGFVLSIFAEGDTTLDRKFAVGMDAGNTPRAYGLYNYLGRTTVQGVVNSGETDGMTAEMFVPWENIGLTVESEADVPENIRVAVRYNVVTGDVGSTGTFLYPGLGNDTNYGKLYKFGANGYSDADQDGWLLGDAVDGYAKSANFDFSQADEGIYGTWAQKQPGNRSLQPNNLNIFVRNIYAERFVFTMRIKPDMSAGSAVLNGVDSSTVNLMAQTSYGMYGFGISLLTNTVNSNAIRIGRISYISRTWKADTEAQAFYTAQYEGSIAEDGVVLTLIKDGDTYYYVYGTPENGVYIGYDRSVIHGGPACPGVISSNCAAFMSDIKCTTYGNSAKDNAEMTRILNSLGAVRVSATTVGGGAATIAEDVVQVGGDAVVTFRPASGAFEIDKVECIVGETETDITDDVRQNAFRGVYVLKNVMVDTTVRVTYKQTETVRTATITMTPPAGVNLPTVHIGAENTTDKTKYYEMRTTGATAVMQLPAGSYTFRLVATGITTTTFTLDVGDNATHEIVFEKAPFGGSVTVNGRTLASSAEWDCTESCTGTAYRPAGIAQNAIVWMSNAKNGNLKFTADYKVTATTDSDPNGGFAISDGSTTYYVFLLRNGVRVIDATHNAGWQDRTYADFSTAISDNLVGKNVSLTLSRTDGEWSFTAAYGDTTFTQKLENMTDSWGGANNTGKPFDLPTGEVAVGFAATAAAVTYSNILLA